MSPMPTVTTADGASIFYKDWGAGRPVVFSHGWPQHADAWDPQLHLAAGEGLRAIAHDRRGHGRSTQTWHGNDMDTYAADLAALLDELDLHDAVLVGHGAGGGEVIRYLGRYGSARVSQAVLLCAPAPMMLRTEKNPAGTPREVFDAMKAGITRDRSGYLRDFADTCFNVGRPGAVAPPPGKTEEVWQQSMRAGMPALLDGITSFSQTDFTADLRAVTVPVLVGHGDDDQLVPIQAAAIPAAKLLRWSTLRVYPNAPHNLHGEFERDFEADLMAFIGR
jgi:non-heme chloroperoxidase